MDQMDACGLEEVKEVFLNYLNVYLIDRNLGAVKELFSPRFSGFGTGFDEVFYNLEKALLLYKRDLTKAPESIHYEILSLNIQRPSGQIAIAACEMNVMVPILKEVVSLRNLRLSTVWVKDDNQWFLEHMHISLPTSVHGEDEPFPVKEIEDRNRVLERLVSEKTAELYEANLALSRLAVTDKLTGLYNRRKMEESLLAELERASRYKRPLSVVLIDIDHFKQINDSFGHVAGDKLLQDLAELFSQGIRKTDICGRWGGEEFFIICPETTLVGASVMAEKLRSTVESYNFETGSKTASFGVTAHRPDDTLELLIHRADQALYQAKRNGRNRVVAVE